MLIEINPKTAWSDGKLVEHCSMENEVKDGCKIAAVYHKTGYIGCTLC